MNPLPPSATLRAADVAERQTAEALANYAADWLSAIGRGDVAQSLKER